MDLRLRGRTAVVTGASKGIGLAITRALADQGASVIAGARNGSAELDDLAARADVRTLNVDLTTTDGPGALVAAATREWGGLDILVNNVGAVRPRLEGFLAITDDDWDRTLTINLLAAVRTMRAAIPLMVDRPGATIVTIGSVNAYLPDPGVIDYSAAKGALANLCKSLSKELAPAIRVNTISPGPARTDLWLGADGVAATVGAGTQDAPSDVVRRQEAQAPTGRFTLPEEVADLALFLASERSANITGSDFRVDGGLIATL
ncbi:SDR family NAD(P)-dependent oxidoreductase [Nocardioides sp. cx-173]|uniref:SDR family NAD(P)-dependent oxidoreductase n=1 Tax=Nocardioides sp. cx-173 TaxID=2898796 RepID=UPI001E2BEA2B|nr:SDR family oxidoreductase [Nocardioides sp. cx-173]MCD4524845.1 SDR family oxidoreductase [Nocardioides sp. cx-173]UGB43350.1 SDR family oxidoreductase [Nocardioides sp. cx-173]